MLVGCNQLLGVDKDYAVGDATPSTGGTAGIGGTASGTGGAGATATGGTGAGGGGTASGQGGSGGGAAAGCGDGVLAGGEDCDDGDDTDATDGCHGCVVADGFTCVGEPSVCSAAPPIVVAKGPGLNQTVGAGTYDGSLGSMACEQVAVVAPAGALVKRVEVVMGVSSTYVGDAVFKIVSPSNTTLTLLSRPGALEAADNGAGSIGDGSDLSISHPLTFRDDAPTDAEQMGAGINDTQFVCMDDNLCDYFPNPGAGPGTNLADFVDEDPQGSWRVCVADSAGSNGSTLDSVELSVWAW
jgi:subtilisin-like proprotein convertase family protein